MSQALFELDQITIASPCQISWEAMQGDERSRHCGECKLQVFNLAGMSRAEAQQLMQSRQGRLCVRFFRRHDGTILTQDCPVGLRGLRMRVTRALCGLAATVLALVGGFFATRQASASAENGDSNPIVQFLDYGPLVRFRNWVDPPVVMGAMCVPMPTPLPNEPDLPPEAPTGEEGE